MWKQKFPVKNITPVSIEPGLLNNLWFQVQHPPFWTNLAFACKTETLDSLCSHALLILTKSSKFKDQVVHELIRGQGSILTGGNILFLEFFLTL